MAEPTVSVEVKESVYGKLKRAAELTQRSIDDVLNSTIDAALVADSSLPQELSGELAAMHVMSDAALFSALHPIFTSQHDRRLAELSCESQQRDLGRSEKEERESLLHLYDKSILLRAQAMAILHQRGHTISRELLESTMAK